MSPTLVSYTRVEKVNGPRCRKFRIWKEDDTLFAILAMTIYTMTNISTRIMVQSKTTISTISEDKEDDNLD